jgi:hypothetical protein
MGQDCASHRIASDRTAIAFPSHCIVRDKDVWGQFPIADLRHRRQCLSASQRVQYIPVYTPRSDPRLLATGARDPFLLIAWTVGELLCCYVQYSQDCMRVRRRKLSGSADLVYSHGTAQGR